MKHFSIWFVLSLVILLVFPSYAAAKAKITVPSFENSSATNNACPETAALKPKITDQLRSELIKQLIRLDRYRIKEREVRPMRATYRLKGTLKRLEVCTLGKGREIDLLLDVQLLNARGKLTHMFTSTVRVSHPKKQKAANEAVRAAINDIVRRIDNAIPRKHTARFQSAKRRKVAGNEYEVRLIPKRQNKR